MQNRMTTLYQLQLIDDQLDLLEELRGDLPIMVNDLQGQIDSIKFQIDGKNEEKDNCVKQRNQNDIEIASINESLKKFKAQLFQVRNNKEYDALTKEIDHSEKEVERLELENVSMEDLVAKLKIEIEEMTPELLKIKDELKDKEDELKQIIKANEREEVKLKEKRDQVAAKVRKSDCNTYMRIRKASRGTAISTINRSACSGCHNVVPPQRQLEIKQGKRIYTCESCGRLLVSPEIANEAKNLLD